MTKPTALVFDKDGTLLDPHATWAPSFRAACESMPHDSEWLFGIMGYDGATDRFLDGSSVMMDPTEVSKALIQSHGVDADLFFSKVEGHTIHSVPITNTAALFEQVREYGLKVVHNPQSCLNHLARREVMAQELQISSHSHLSSLPPCTPWSPSLSRCRPQC